MKLPIKLHRKVKHYRKIKLKGDHIGHSSNNYAFFRNHTCHRTKNNVIAQYTAHTILLCLFLGKSCMCSVSIEGKLV
jgi:hypothetical protein